MPQDEGDALVPDLDDTAADDLPPLEPARPYWWMWPARHLEWIRPGLRAATDADSRRLRSLPSIVGALLLPAAAILIPALASVGTATTGPFVQADPYEPWSLLLYDVFTESVPFMLAALAIGLLSPSAGVLFALAYAVGNVGATIATGELEPPLPALYGRFVSYLVLWLLVVEVPLLGRMAIERWRGEAAPRPRRALALLGGSLLTTGLVLAWALSAALLIGAIFWLTGPFGIGPTLRASNTLETQAQLFVIPAAVLVLVLLGFRYIGRGAPLASDEPADPPPSSTRRLIRRIAGMVLAMTVLTGVLHQVIDVVVLAGGIVLGRPVARLILRVTGIAGPLARIPWPIRVAAAVAAAFAFSYGFLSVFNGVEISRWFYAIIAMVVSFVIIEVALQADSVALDARGTSAGVPAENAPAVAAVVTTLVVSLQLAALVLPAIVFADAFGDLADTFLWIATNSILCAAIAAMLLMGALDKALSSDDKAKPPPAKKPPPIISPWTQRPGGPPPRPWGTPPPKAPPPPEPPFRFWDPRTWF